MTLTELRYILAVAKERHFGKAARACFVSQPTLSLGIKKLEDELDAILFERGPKEITVTPLGRQVVDQAEKALREVNAIKDIVKRNRDPLKMPVRIGAIYTIGPYLFPGLIPVIQDLFPDLPLLIEENFTHNLIARLYHGDIDVAILSEPFDEPGLESVSLYEEPFVALLPTAHTLSNQTMVSIDDISKETVLLLGPQHCFREQVLEICPKCFHSMAENIDLQNTLEGGSLETIRYMVASGVGVTILPATAACAEKYAQRLLTIRRFSDIKPHRRVALAWRKGFPRPQVIDLIARAVAECDISCISMLFDANHMKTEKKRVFS
ncbi:MAG: LysR substrate-binding domain-containing protein [Gammaproteobacteria bacterium]|nr:LysR substrate-binding domain-containing protein [Gammaproteobacteria bacterium]